MNASPSQLQDAIAGLGTDGELRVIREFPGRATLLEHNAPAEKPRRLLMLQHSLQDRRLNPFIARDEFRLLQALWESGMPVPRPLHYDVGGEIPFLLTEFAEGEPRFKTDDLTSLCDQLAEILCSIHHFDIARNDLSFLPAQMDRIARRLESMADDPLGIRRTLRAALPKPLGGSGKGSLAHRKYRRRSATAKGSLVKKIDMNATALLHGDFWPGNLLWRSGELTAIIDWEDAMLGDPLGDLGKSRLEMRWAFGEDAAERYTAAYLARNRGLNTKALPFWDLWGALRLSHFADWFEDRETTERMNRQYEAFVEDALRRL